MKRILAALIALFLAGSVVFTFPAASAEAADTDPEGTVIIYGPTSIGKCDGDLLTENIESPSGTFSVSNASDWKISPYPSTDKYADNGADTPGSGVLNGTGSATWTINEGALSGRYSVYAYNVRSEDESGGFNTDVEFKVCGDDGEKTVQVNQQTDSGNTHGWVYLCTESFDGIDDYVTAEITTDGVVTYVKDIKFIPVGDKSKIVTPYGKVNGAVVGFVKGKIGTENFQFSVNTDLIVPSSETVAVIPSGQKAGHYYKTYDPAQQPGPQENVTIKPDITETGRYRVYLWQSYHTGKYNDSPDTVDVTFIENSTKKSTVKTGIRYKPGTVEGTVYNDPKWIDIGEYNFTSTGINDIVRISTSDSVTDFRVGAIKLEKVREIEQPKAEIVSGTFSESSGTGIYSDESAIGFFAKITSQNESSIPTKMGVKLFRENGLREEQNLPSVSGMTSFFAGVILDNTAGIPNDGVHYRMPEGCEENEVKLYVK